MAGLTLDDIDVFEINEAFASQVRVLPGSRLEEEGRDARAGVLRAWEVREWSFAFPA
jgi:hypothetical protein